MPDARRSAAAVTFAHCPNHLSYVSDKGYPRFRGAVAAAPQLCSLSATSCYGRRVPALLVLWDIDHTLIDSGGAEVHVYQLVFRDLFGRDLPDLVPFAGRTERAIVLDLLAQAEIPEPRQHVDEFLARIGAHAPELAGLVAARGRALPGAAAALAAVAAQTTPIAAQSVLTGERACHGRDEAAHSPARRPSRSRHRRLRRYRRVPRGSGSPSRARRRSVRPRSRGRGDLEQQPSRAFMARRRLRRPCLTRAIGLAGSGCPND
jgi:hypothetical protein